MKDFLGVTALYPILGFIGGFLPFVVCAILYATGYKPRVRRRKHPSYIVTSAVIFVITVIIVTMIAVYFKAQVSNPDELLAYIILPVVYLANILVFTGFYYLFSVRSSSKTE